MIHQLTFLLCACFLGSAWQRNTFLLHWSQQEQMDFLSLECNESEALTLTVGIKGGVKYYNSFYVTCLYDISVLKKQHYQEQMELKALWRKQQQSKWYKKGKKKTSDSHSESNRSTAPSFSSGHSSQSLKRTSQLMFQPIKWKCSVDLSESSGNHESLKHP